MIRIALAATFFATAAQAEAPAAESDATRNLAFCGSQVATLAWFYQGAVNDGSPELQPELDGLLAMQSIFIRQVEQNGDEIIELFKRMPKASVNDLAGRMQGPRDESALALSDVTINVRSCADLYFEKIDEENEVDAGDDDEATETPKKN